MGEPRVVYTADQIRERLQQIAAQITTDYKDKKLVLVGILKGAAFLLADLARLVPSPVDFEFVDVTISPGDRGEVVNLTYATHIDVSGRHVLILKDGTCLVGQIRARTTYNVFLVLPGGSIESCGN